MKSQAPGTLRLDERPGGLQTPPATSTSGQRPACSRPMARIYGSARITRRASCFFAAEAAGAVPGALPRRADMRTKVLPVLVLTMTGTAALPAQVTFKTTGYELRDALADVAHIWTSPLHAGKKDWLGVLGVAAGAAALLPVDDQIDSWIVRHPSAAIVEATDPWNEEHPELGDLSTGKRLLPISGAMILSG